MTHGEKLVLRLLRSLDTRRYFFHYEPILLTEEGKTRKPDFVIVSAKYGVVVVEVKDWVKLKGGDQEEIHTIRKDGLTASYPNPYRTAEQYAYALIEGFEQREELWRKYRGKRSLKFPWQVMVVLPNISQKEIEQFEKKRIWAPHVVVGKEALVNVDSFEKAIATLPWQYQLDKSGIQPETLDIIREVLKPYLVVEDAEGNPVGTITRVQERLISEPVTLLEPQQMALPLVDAKPLTATESLNEEVRLVRGVAGSGKTLVLVRRVRQLAQRYPDSKQLVLSFNIEIAKDLERRIGLPPERVKVVHFHKLCRAILDPIWRNPIDKWNWMRSFAAEEIAQLGLPLEFILDELFWRRERGLYSDESYLTADRKGRGYRLDKGQRELINIIFSRYQAAKEKHIKNGIPWYDWEDVGTITADYLEKHPPQEQYPIILIDEAQDFAPSWMKVVKLLLQPGGSLFLCDDPAQSIFNSYSWSQKGISIVGRTTILHVPFRSTLEISLAAHALIEADENLRQTEDRPEPDFTSYELGTGPKPLLIGCADEDAEIRFVNQQVNDLLDDDMPTSQIAILCPTEQHTHRWAHLQTQGIYVNYFEKMKGLEFNAVFTPHLGEIFMPDDDTEMISRKRRKVFTAMTRARRKLILSHQGELPLALHPLREQEVCETYAI
ncbi:MAG: UvrD-helicase domain-containing protein [Anaerolinea sp.]|nr:UvrD-helicase domain-containing protein [Anaerolinea sp.]